ncbi:hypothetical protein GUJ93_ZPchr0008g11638 [Zizania palustris]|uniref:Uncharacterized protein n=1 Tax=Zizania palustris TaxID=103762 RepID=A0A8J5R3C3_ZIZPA|nr:hypothetical protein GUJ93_ZPchr0008g11638 [Zizania palustris]
MARPHRPCTMLINRGRRLISASSTSSVDSCPVILHAAWITALVAVCLALCTIHSRRSPSSSSSSARQGHQGSRGAASRRRPGQGDGTNSGGTGAAGSTVAMPARVSPTPSDKAKAGGAVVDENAMRAAATEQEEMVIVASGNDHVAQGGAVQVTVIDVGTHGPIAPVFLPPPDPIPPRRSLSAKHMRFAERLGTRIRSRRWGWDDQDQDDGGDEDARRGEPAESNTLWTKKIILGERCRVGRNGDEDDDAMVRWKSYRPRQPRSVPVTRSNSFAGVGSRGT